MIDDVIRLVRKAGDEALRIRKEGFTITTKEHKFDLLTEADTAVENTIVSGLEQLYPGDKILAEETAQHITDCTGRVWMIDPIDGTKYFAEGNDGFAHMIGLAVDGVPMLAVAYAPARDWLMYAERGKGSWLLVKGEERQLRVSDIKRLSDAVAITRFRAGEDRPEDRFWRDAGVKGELPEGSVSLKVVRIGLRDGDVQCSAPARWHKWDTCCPQVLLEEAGGRMTDENGRALDYLQQDTRWKGIVVSSNGHVHDELITAIVRHYPVPARKN